MSIGGYTSKSYRLRSIWIAGVGVAVNVGVRVIVGEEVADGGATVVAAGFVSTAGAVIVEVNTSCVDG